MQSQPRSTPASRRGRLVRMLAYALRHHPDDFGISLDPAGWVELELLVERLRERLPRQMLSLEIREVERLLLSSSGQRFELIAGRIRARYGHSLAGIVTGQPKRPPQYLYHGTSGESFATIQSHGLRSMGRTLVHLTSDLGYACRVAGRESNRPLVLRIDARSATTAGIVFLQATHHVWQVDAVPMAYLTTLLQVGDDVNHKGPSLDT